ncbi:type IV pilus modification PilV family protein [Parafrigoribacterium soli]|uniref:type IV pilus modification PilV family protein n=1 Tax=Parafrigoribacterium soli TaxID=3144663 RepID=UPI0032EE4D69
MPESITPRPSSTDAGFSLIEIVVSMFILALLAMALIPLLIQGMKASAASAAVASATQLVNSQLDMARSQASTCSGLQGAPSVAVGAPSTYRGVPLQLNVTPVVCPTPAPTATNPSTVSYTVKVVRSDTGQTLATASTLIYVNGG